MGLVFSPGGAAVNSQRREPLEGGRRPLAEGLWGHPARRGLQAFTRLAIDRRPSGAGLCGRTRQKVTFRLLTAGNSVRMGESGRGQPSTARLCPKEPEVSSCRTPSTLTLTGRSLGTGCRILCSLAYAFNAPPFKEIAAQLGVQPLDEFWNLDLEVLDAYFDEPDELESFKQEWGPAKYFSPTEALVSVRAILGQLIKTPLRLEQYGQNITQELIEDLAEVEKALQLAEEQGAKFYFFVGE